MNKEIIELLDSIKNKKQEVQNFVNENKLEEAKKSKEELIQLQNKLDILYDLEKDCTNELEDASKSVNLTEKIDVSDAFFNGISCLAVGRDVSDEVKGVINNLRVENQSMKLTGDEGIIVPQDVSTKIKKLRREFKSFENYVNVQKVADVKGSRVIEKNADSVPFDVVDEEALFPTAQKPEFVKIAYEIKKMGGILELTKEFVRSVDTSFKGYLQSWIAKKGVATRNKFILKAIDDKKSSSIVPVTGLDDFKKIVNITLDPAIAQNAKIFTNQSGFQWLDTLKDADGRYILQQDVTQKTDGILFGKYTVVVFSNSVLPNNTNKVPFYIGDLKEAVTIFDFETLSVETSSEASDYFKNDKVGIKVRERMDVQIIDEHAVVKAELDASSLQGITRTKGKVEKNVE